MQVLKNRNRAAYLIGALLSAQAVINMSALAQNYFDFNNTSGLTPSAGNVADWQGSFWQATSNPGTATPGSYIAGESVFFNTGGINRVNLNGAATAYDISQLGTNTETYIGGTGTLTIAGTYLENSSTRALQFNRGLTLALQSASRDWLATNGQVIVNSNITGAAGTLRLSGTQGIVLAGSNNYTGTTIINGKVEAGSASAFGDSLVRLNSGELLYRAGLTQDFSLQFVTTDSLLGNNIINTGSNNITWAGVLTGSGTLTKTGVGRLALNGNNATYSGKVVVQQGILSTGNVNSLGTATAATDGLEIMSGATLDFSGTTILTNERITLAGHGVGNLGAMMNNAGGSRITNQVTLSGHTTLNANVRWDFDAVFNGNGYSVTKIGTDQTPFEGSSQNIGNIYVKQGSVNFTGSSDMGYFDSLTFGNTAYVNQGAGLLFWGKANDAKRITLNGGYLQRNSSAGSSVNQVLTVTGGLELNAGASDVRHGESQLVFALGAINRHVGSTLNVQDTSAIVFGTTTGNPAMATTTSANVNGIIGGYLTYGGNTWAVNSGATQVGSTTNVITGLAAAGYSTNDFTGAGEKNVDVTASASTPSGFNVNTLRFNTAAPVTLTLTGDNTLASGGLLVTSTVGNNAVTITGTGTLRGAASGDLIIHQNNASNVLTIDAIIANNGGATALTKSGAGTLNLRKVNTYTGNTYINGAAGTGNAGLIDVNNIATTGNDNLGATSNQIFMNNGGLRYSNTTTSADLTRNVNLLSGGGIFDVVTQGVTLRLSGVVSGESLAADEGHFAGQGNLTKNGEGTLEISNAGNSYTGTTIINAGVVRMIGGGKLGAGNARLTVNAGALELNGTSQSIGLLMGGTSGVIRNGSATDSVLSIGNDDATFVSNGTNWGTGSGYAGVIQDGGTGKVSLVKNGVGYQILSGASSYTGTTAINAGTLQVGSGATGTTSTARTGSGSHTVESGATLAGNGIVGGSVWLKQGALLTIGNFGQTVAQTLTINGGLIADGNIGFDVWTHTGTTTTVDTLRFTASGAVALNGDLFVNNVIGTTWAAGEKVKLIDWGAVSVNDRSLAGRLDISALDTAAGAYWDTRRFLLDGTIVAMAVRNAYRWDANTGTAGAQDGAGTWNTSNSNWINTTSGANAPFVAGSDVFFGANSGAAGTVTIDNTGGILVRDMTFETAGSSYYTIAGTGANGVLTLENDSLVTTSHALVDDFGTTISAVIAGQGWVKAGAGRLILSGANTFTGDLSVLQGVLDVRNATALGTTAGKTIVGSGATLTIRGGITVAENIDLAGSGVNNSGALRNQAGANTFSGNIALLSDSQITSRTDTMSLTGVISGVGGVTITGEDSLAIVRFAGSGSNTYTGSTNINSGILLLQKNQFVNAIGANTTVNIGDGLGSSRDILRLGQSDQISDTNTILNFRGQGSGAGVFQLNGFNETVAAIQSANGDGIIENSAASAASTLTVSNSGNYTYSGVMQNGGVGVLNFTKTNTGTLTLTGNNSFTGVALIENGTLQLSGVNGSITGASSVKVLSGATLRLLNSVSANNNNRLQGNLTMAGGTFDFANSGGTASYSEALGVVDLQGGANTISTSQAAAGQTSTVTVDGITRNGRATLNFSGTGVGAADQRNRVLFADPNLQLPSLVDNAILGSWITVGSEFATYGANGIRALTSAEYVTAAQSSWTFRDNVKITAATTLSADRDINSLNIQQATATNLNLGTHELKIESGGLIVSGDFDSIISNGRLTAGTSENVGTDLVIHQNSAGRTLDITAQITDNGTGAVGLTKAGDGILQLSGANTFTGGVTLNKGTIKLNNANAIASGNDLAVHNGTLDLNGFAINVDKLSSDRDSKTGVITNSSATATTITVGADNSSSLYAGRITNETGTGAVSLRKVGAGTLELSGNSTYTGTTTVEAGTLRIGSATALGATGAASSTTVNAGATLLFAAEGLYNETINIAGRGADGRGALVLAQESVLRGGADQVRIMNVNFTGHTTINTNSKRVDFDGAFNANNNSITKVGNAEMTIEGSPTSNMANLYIKQGAVTFGGGNNTLGTSSGTIYVNSGATMRFFNTGTQSKNVTLRGGDWARAGSTNTNTFTVTDGIKLEAGASSFTHSATQQVINLNAIRRDVGATFNVNNASGPALNTTNTNVNGIIGGYMTWSSNTWAVSGAGGTIAGLSTYQTNTFAAGNNVDVSGAQGPAAGFNVNTLRFNSGAAATTLTLTGDNVISSGGILVTSAVGSQAARITGGSITGSAGANGDLIIHQNNTGAAFTIESIIKNNGADATSLTKSGAGTLILTGQNTYSGRTFINGAAGSTTTGVLQVSDIKATGADNLGDNSASNDLVFNRGTLRYTGATTSTNRDVQLLSGGGIFEVTTAETTLTINGAISGGTLATDEGFYDGESTLTKTGIGTLTLGGTLANTYTGNTLVEAGVLQLNKTGVDAIAGDAYVNGSGLLRLLQADQIKNTSILYMNGASAVFDMNGFSETLGGLGGTSASALIQNLTGLIADLTVDVAANRSYTYVGQIVGDIALVKDGAGTQILTGTNDYTGGTRIEEGTLQVGDGGSSGTLGTGGVAVESGARLAINTSADYDIRQDIYGEGSFVQVGSGTTRFMDGASFDYSGGTTVQAGRLVVNAFTNNMGPVVVEGGTLMGSGRVASDSVIIKDKGRLAIGDPSLVVLEGSILTIGGDLTVQRSANSSTPRITFNIFGEQGVYNDAALALRPDLVSAAAYYTNSIILGYEDDADPGYSLMFSHDHLEVEGALTLDAGAIIEIKLADGYVFNAGDVFDFIDWVGMGIPPGGWSPYTDMILPELSSHLTWDRSLFAQHGILTVTLVPEPGRAMLLLLGISALIFRRRRR